VRFVNTHTEAYDAATRDTQRDQLLAEVGEPGLPVVVVGDFNATPAHVGIPAPYVDAWTAAGGDPLGGCTYGHAADLSNPTAVMVDRIDYVWVRDAGVAGCVVRGTDPADRTPGGLWPSDHACVVAELVLGR
jgi:endonuclease/exonuclease/phosphatase family metal-dependent hydrolase